MENERYHNNKEEINKKRSITIVCECGLSYTHNHKTRHLQTLRHKKFLEITHKEVIVKFD